MWPFAFNSICGAFVIFHLTLAGLMLGADKYSFSMLPLLVIDVLIKYCNSDFYPISRRLPLATACQVDDAYRDHEPDTTAYKVPALRARTDVSPAETFDSIHFSGNETVGERTRAPTASYQATFQQGSVRFAPLELDGPVQDGDRLYVG